MRELRAAIVLILSIILWLIFTGLIIAGVWNYLIAPLVGRTDLSFLQAMSISFILSFLWILFTFKIEVEDLNQIEAEMNQQDKEE